MKKVITFTVIFSIFSVIILSSPKSQQVIAETENVKTVQLGGEPFGIKMFSDGVLVIDVEKTLYGSELSSPASVAGIKANDIIKSANGETIYSNEQFTNMILNSEGKDITLTIDRDGENIKKTIYPVRDSQGNYRAGLWIKDSAAGIGTITYYDTETNTFGALGHGICESTTGKLIPLFFGEIAKAKISDVNRSENGTVGSLNGYFDGDVIGEAYSNSNCGIFGQLKTKTVSQTIEIADKDEINKGDAQIYCTVDGENKCSYDIKIRKINKKEENTMVIEITDPDLLEITGGIVQGMSGSPIVQNGKLVGAVTHVLVNNVKYGYGICIEEMLKHS